MNYKVEILAARLIWDGILHPEIHSWLNEVVGQMGSPDWNDGSTWHYGYNLSWQAEHIFVFRFVHRMDAIRFKLIWC